MNSFAHIQVQKPICVRGVENSPLEQVMREAAALAVTANCRVIIEVDGSTYAVDPIAIVDLIDKTGKEIV